MNTMVNPIEALDSVWIEDLTMIEVRDYIQAGKTNALILTGGIEQNGPYLVTGKHNYVLRSMGESIAREMGNTLVAPIVTLEPGNPESENISPGTVYLFNNGCVHAASNRGKAPRTHLLWDVVLDPKSARVLLDEDPDGLPEFLARVHREERVSTPRRVAPVGEYIVSEEYGPGLWYRRLRLHLVGARHIGLTPRRVARIVQALRWAAYRLGMIRLVTAAGGPLS